MLKTLLPFWLLFRVLVLPRNKKKPRCTELRVCWHEYRRSPWNPHGRGWREVDLEGEYTQVPVGTQEDLESAVSTCLHSKIHLWASTPNTGSFWHCYVIFIPGRKRLEVLTGAPGCGSSRLGPWPMSFSCPDFSNCKMNIGWLKGVFWRWICRCLESFRH